MLRRIVSLSRNTPPAVPVHIPQPQHGGLVGRQGVQPALHCPQVLLQRHQLPQEIGPKLLHLGHGLPDRVPVARASGRVGQRLGRRARDLLIDALNPVLQRFDFAPSPPTFPQLFHRHFLFLSRRARRVRFGLPPKLFLIFLKYF
nr:MAG TPA: hypothetical protein [Bacteriophage sp.]